MDYSEQSQMRQHLRKTQLRPTPQLLWRRSAKALILKENSTMKKPFIFHVVNAQVKQKKLDNAGFPQLYKDICSIEVNQQGFSNQFHTTEDILCFFSIFELEVSCLSALQRQ